MPTIKNINIPTILILGIITVVELIVTKDMSGSFLLWMLYGLYKME